MKIRRGRKASSLVTTLLVIVVLSTIVVAFLQSMSVERATARSYLTKYQAQLAAEAALASFLDTMAVIQTNGAYIIQNVVYTNNAEAVPMLAVFGNGGTRTMYPLLSTSNMSSYQMTGTNQDGLRSYLASLQLNLPTALNVNRRIGGGSLIDGAVAPYGSKRFPGQLVAISTNADSVVRYAYRVGGDDGRLNLKFFGFEYNGAGSRTNVNEDRFAAAVAVTGPATNMMSASELARFKTLTNALATGAATIEQIFDDEASYVAKRQFFTYNGGQSVSYIPSGFYNASNQWVGYPDGGKPKYDINEIATNSTDPIGTIVGIINSNLPDFKKRDRAFEYAGLANQQQRYLRRIAASIVDYIDSDVAPSSTSDGEPAGKDLNPVVHKVCEKYEYLSQSGSTYNFQHTLFVELWNPYTTNVSGNFRMRLVGTRPVEITGAVAMPFDPIEGTVPVTLAPNQFKVYRLAQQPKTFVSMSGTNSQVTLPQTSSGDSDSAKWHSRYKAYWNNALSDETSNENNIFPENGPGLKKDSATMNPGNTIYSVNLHRPVFISGKGFRSVADPRQGYINNYVWESVAYNNADLRWNGLGTWASTASTYYQNYNISWAMRDFMRANPSSGVTVASTLDPTTAPDVTQDPNNAPSYIRNGAMQTIAELGHIYDPVHANDYGYATAAGNPDNYFSSGGGRTLRIGQPEFNYPISPFSPSSAERPLHTWSAGGMGAMNLLDLFTTTKKDASGEVMPIGKINVNSASREVLASLFWNFSPVSDRGANVSGTPSLTDVGAYAIADQIISNRPYAGAADLNRILGSFMVSTNFSPQFGASSTNLAVMDRGREEMFRKAYDSLSFNSTGFSVYCIGQVTTKSGKAVAECRLMAQVEFRKETNPGGVVRLRPYIIYKRIY